MRKENADSPALEAPSRRDALRGIGLGLVGAVAGATALGKIAHAAQGKPKGIPRWAMVIDLQRCVGCGGCMISCKNENNVEEGFAWSTNIRTTKGKFPNVMYEYIPTLCNHCENAPCIENCPTEPKSMHKEYGDVTAHDPEICIGCGSCVRSCPYGVPKLHKKATHEFWRDSSALIKDVTQSPDEVAKSAGGETVPYYNPDRENYRKGSGLRKEGVVEKCTLCDHRLAQGKIPYCVDRCPANARIVGDLNDPNSDVNKILGKFKPMRLKEHLGTEPKVFYVRTFNPATYEGTKGSI